MKKWISEISNIFADSRVVIVLFFLVGVFCRVYLPGSYPLGIDQVFVIENAQSISEGDFKLVGPRTGPANMFTGPLIYYVTAVAYLFVNSPYALVIVAVFISVLTLLTMYYLSRKYLQTEIAESVAIIACISPFLIRFDRVPWNPVLMVLSSALVFFPLISIEKKVTWKEVLLLFLGVFLGYQAHFSGLFLLPLAGLAIIYKARQKLLLLATISIAFVISLLPTFLFDIRNNWINTHGLLDLVGSDEKVGSYAIFSRVIEKFMLSSEIASRLLLYGTTQPLISAVSLLLVVSLFAVIFKNGWYKTWQFQLLAGWIVISNVAYAAYRADTPEYYFLLQVPALLLLLGYGLSSAFSRFQTRILLASVALYSVFFTISAYKLDSGLELYNHLQVEEFVHKTAQSTGVKQIVYDLDNVTLTGFPYIFKDFTPQSEGAIVHVLYPYTGKVYSDRFSDTLAVWIDPRTDDTKSYILTEKYLLTYDKSLQLYEINSSDLTGVLSSYVVQSSLGENLGTVAIVDSSQNHQINNLFESQKNTEKSKELAADWKLMPLFSENNYAKKFADNSYIGIYIPTASVPAETQLRIISQVTFE